jgi:hypothetical protein
MGRRRLFQDIAGQRQVRHKYAGSDSSASLDRIFSFDFIHILLLLTINNQNIFNNNNNNKRAHFYCINLL